MSYDVSSGILTAARLKTFGLESVVVDRNAQVGDSWAHRYDSLKFHVPTSSCEMPYAFKLPFYLQEK